MTIQTLLNAGVPPLIAILRGVEPDDVLDIGRALTEAGIRIIEIPLNSPQPLLSIERLRANVADDILVGAGTVTTEEAVENVAIAGGGLIVAPNSDASVIARAIELGLDVLPGVMTPTEAFAAVAAGARHLKLFPAISVGTTHLKALREVLPRNFSMWAVGGTNAANLGEWLRAGAVGIAIGSALYRSGLTADAVRAQAVAIVQAWRDLEAT